MKFHDIPQIKKTHYRVNILWDHLEHNLDRYKEAYNLELIPEFQRGHVWTEEQQRAYVEWILRGGESGREIIFNYPGWQTGRYVKTDKMVLVDGLQRITAVQKFLNNTLPVFGLYLNDFEDKMPIMEYDFIFFVGGYTKYSDILQWYLDINSGGTPHAESEINRVAELLNKIKQDGK